MLIWYANLPEETTFFLARQSGNWVYVSIALMLFKFVVPFLALLPRRAKRSQPHLIVISCSILVMQYVDLYWLVFPNLSSEEVIFGIPEILIWAASREPLSSRSHASWANTPSCRSGIPESKNPCITTSYIRADPQSRKILGDIRPARKRMCHCTPVPN